MAVQETGINQNSPSEHRADGLPISIDVVHTGRVNYAMAHNRIAIVHRLVITNTMPEPLYDVTVRVEARDAQRQPLTRAWERQLDMVMPGEVTFEAVGLVPDPEVLIQIEETRPASLVVTVTADGASVEHRADLLLQAYNQWSFQPQLPALSTELLAAFVLPNHPVIGELLAETSAVLADTTADPSLQGYQQGPERVDAIVAAIYQAMQTRGIRYSNPPASWDGQGQKVRTPEQVLDDRVGTCLDTTVVMAAAMEQAGIRPLLWVMDGHAFVGYWRHEDGELGQTAITEIGPAANAVHLGEIGMVETTALTVSDDPTPFEDAHRRPRERYLLREPEAFRGIVDVTQARRNGIVPLPARHRAVDGSMQVVEYRAADLTGGRREPAERHTTSAPTTRTRRTAVPPRVERWKNALLDLSLRNRLINFSDRQSTPLLAPEGALPQIEDMLHDSTALRLLPSDQVDAVHLARGLRGAADLPQETLRRALNDRDELYTDLPSRTYTSRMRGLAYKARTLLDETGANNLYLALGSLVWRFHDRDLRSPLILVPVRLTGGRRGLDYRLELDESGSSTPNFCLIEKLRQELALDIPGLAEPESDESGIDLAGAFDAVRHALAEAELPFHVAETADLAILQFAKFRLWKDLDEHWQDFAANPLVRHLVESPLDTFADPAAPEDERPADLDELATRCPVPADSSQLDAVAQAVQGRTFVLEGPPGTGKSQTITNLLARTVAEGQRVLFVAEKRAALDVVKKRLDTVGLGPFSLDLHDKGSKPAAVRQQLLTALEHRTSLDQDGYRIAEDDLRAASRSLARYSARLHEPNSTGASLYNARQRDLALGPGPTLPVPDALPESGSEASLTDIRRALDDLPDVAEAARLRPHHQWGFVDVATDAPPDRGGLARALARAETAWQALDLDAPVDAAVLSAALVGDDLLVLAALAEPGRPPLAVLDQVAAPSWESLAAVRADVEAFALATHPGMDVATPAVLDMPLDELLAAAHAAANSRFFGRKKRLRAVFDRLRPGLAADAHPDPRRVLALVQSLVAVRDQVGGLASRVTSIPGVTVPPSWNPFLPEDREMIDSQVGWLRWAAAKVTDRQNPFTGALRDHLATAGPRDRRWATDVAELGHALIEVSTAVGTGPEQLRRWSASSGLLSRWRSGRVARTDDARDERFLQLRRWTDLLSLLEPLRRHGLEEARRLILDVAVPLEEVRRAFERGLARASLNERMRTTGLKDFDASAHDRTVKRFAGAATAVREHLKEAIPDHIAQSRPYSAHTSTGQVGALQRELTKTRRGLGIRSLISRYGDLVTQLTPCALVSPDSLSRFFAPGGATFDLVVFDEASQIQVADAIGAMGRARAVVVVGDSKQMPPTVFGGGTTDDLDEPDVPEDAPPQDEESILSEAVQSRVPRLWLSWHYRSQNEALIAFSNRHYYDGRLSSFPSPAVDGDGTGVSLVRVDGQFHRSGSRETLRTNPDEAQAVVDEVFRRFRESAPASPSIGVVTFNAQQRTLIDTMLRATGDPAVIEALDTDAEGLFVKNLENVQGDERDAILFSVAFSKNAKGALPLNFGPLNRAGGERRLNVAVTRARREVVVFCSFDPDELRAEDTSSLGLKHLRAYLDMAHSGVRSSGDAVGRPPTPPDRHRDDVAAALRERGFAVQTDVGLSDFRIDLAVARAADPDRPVVAVLLDGPGWARRRTVGDRDGLPVDVLRDLLGWGDVARVWLPSWLHDREAVLDELVARLAGSPPDRHDALAQATELNPVPAAVPPVLPAALVAPQAATVPSPPVVPEDPRTLPGELPFVAWEPGDLGDRDVLDRLADRGISQSIKAVLLTAVRAEGPVQLDRLARLVAQGHGLAKVRQERIEAILALLPSSVVVDRQERFAWPPGLDLKAWDNFRRSQDTKQRPLDHVALREIGNAMVALCRVSAGMAQDELLRETLAVFGGRRMTEGIADRLNLALNTALSTGRLRDHHGLVIVG